MKHRRVALCAFAFAVCVAVADSATPDSGIVRRVDPPKRAADWSMRVIDDATPILQNAIDEVFRLGGGRVVVGRGFYSIKGLRLRSRVTLYLERGAILQASRNAADFDILGKDAVEPIPPEEYERGRSRRWSPPRGELERTSPRLHISDPLSPWNDAIIRVLNARDVAIIGEEGAVIDGANGYNPKGELNYRGVHGISAIASTNVVLRGFTIRHAGHWAMLLRYCGNVTCERVAALGGHDGFHARGCNTVRVEDCYLHTGDDAVAGFDNCSMVVRGCDLSSSCNALRLGGRDILIENCHAHGPCEYVFRDRLPAQAKIEGLWNPAVVAGRHTMATFFIYICDYTMPVRHQPGNIVVRNCKVENALRLVRYNFRSDAWQYVRPLADIRFEGIEAAGLCLPVALNGGKAEDGDLPLEFTMTDSILSFAKPQDEVFSVSNVRTFALTNVTVSGVSAPLVRTWGRPPEMKLSGVHGVPAEIVEGKGPFRCPWWK